MRKPLLVVRMANAAVLAFLALFFFLGPVAIVGIQLLDPAIRSGGIPAEAWRLHRTLSPKLEKWANERTQSVRATQLSTSDISGTEWPLFGSVFYLWATESLQDAWDKNPGLVPVAPNVYARPAIEAVARLVQDPKQASWVKSHWGDQYLKTENVFYRMLLISGLTSYTRLTGEGRYLPLLREQTNTLADELNASPYGILDDYPGQCFPCDVLSAVAAIHRADQVLGTDHSAFLARSLKAFQAVSATDPTGLPPYVSDPRDGRRVSASRGCGNSDICIFSPELWPDQARTWYEAYVRNYWQEVWTGVGFREFARGTPDSDWHFDVDSGPVIKGYGFAACAFGVGAARVNGHMEHAYPLTAEMYSACWPLPNGGLFIPRLLSNAIDAPYLGEAGVLFGLTRQPMAGVEVRTGGSVPTFTRVILGMQLVVGLGLLLAAYRSARKCWGKGEFFPYPRDQFVLWACLLAGGMLSILY